MSIPCASRVFFITISWFLSFCGCVLSVSEIYSGRLNDCFLTVSEFFVFIASVSGLFKGCFLVNLLIVSSNPGCFWAFSRVFPGVYFLFTDCYQSVSGQNHVCLPDIS